MICHLSYACFIQWNRVVVVSMNVSNLLSCVCDIKLQLTSVSRDPRLVQKGCKSTANITNGYIYISFALTLDQEHDVVLLFDNG